MRSLPKAMSLVLLLVGVLAAWAAKGSYDLHREGVQLFHHNLGRAQKAVAALHEAKAAGNAPETRKQNAEFDDATSRAHASNLRAGQARRAFRFRAGAAVAAIVVALTLGLSWRPAK